jgi:hypothetical protein
MPEINRGSPADAGKGLAKVVQEDIDELRQRFPRAEYLLEEPRYGDEDVVVRIFGPSDEMNAIANAAAQLSAAIDQHHALFILPLVSPLIDCPVRP